MTWTNISDQSPSWSPDTDETPAWTKKTKLLTDPEFNDEDEWDISGIPLLIPTSNVEISNGKLKSTSTSCFGLVTPVSEVSFVEGQSYKWSFTVESVGSGGGLVNLFLDNTLRYTHSNNDGIFEGTFVAVGKGTPIQITISNKIIVIENLYIENITAWTDTSTSSSWTPLTDKTTVWS